MAEVFKVRVDNIWKNAVPYVKVNGVWKVATPYTKKPQGWVAVVS